MTPELAPGAFRCERDGQAPLGEESGGAPFLYGAFGLTLASDVPLPLPPAHGGAHVRVRVGSPRRVDGPEAIAVRHTPAGDLTIEYRSLARFEIAYDRIDIAPDPGGDPGTWTALAAGPVLAALLHRRGYFVLHACSLVFDGAAIAVAGRSGAGKSTLAAAALRLGARLLDDDLAVVDDRLAVPCVLPGASRISLLPDSLDEFAPQGGVARGFGGKHMMNPGALVADAAVPLAGVFLLDARAEPIARRLGAVAAAMALRAHLYGACTLDPAGDPRPLRRAAALASRMPVWSLSRPDGYGALDDTIAQLERLVRDAR